MYSRGRTFVGKGGYGGKERRLLRRGRVDVGDSACGVGGGMDQEVTRVVGNGRPFRRSVDGKFGVEGTKLLGLGRLTFEVDGLNVIGDN